MTRTYVNKFSDVGTIQETIITLMAWSHCCTAYHVSVEWNTFPPNESFELGGKIMHIILVNNTFNMDYGPSE